MILIPLRTVNPVNIREHWKARVRRVKAERDATAWALIAATKPALPCVVTLTRLAPSNGLDDDSLPVSCKAVRDQIAEWLGVDDKHRHIVRYEYAQRRGEWGVEINFESNE